MYNHSRFPLSVQLDGLYIVAIFLSSVVGENCATDFICMAATPLGVQLYMVAYGFSLLQPHFKSLSSSAGGTR